MENTRVEQRYRLPTRIASRKKLPAIELVARALDVPLGYLLAGFSDAEIDRSIYGVRVRSGEIELTHALRPQQHELSLQTFVRRLPTSESELVCLPLHSYYNQFAFCVVFQFEKLYSGLEMLMVNEPPLIFWDNEDIKVWIHNMRLNSNDAQTLKAEFGKYQEYFRRRAKSGSKRYKVLINYNTIKRFLEQKTPAARDAFCRDVADFLKLPTFEMALYRPARRPDFVYGDEIPEVEVLCKQPTIPSSLEGTISVQIQQTPPRQTPISYFVSPVPRNHAVLQKHINFINQTFASALNQYRVEIGSQVGATGESILRRHTITLLRAI